MFTQVQRSRTVDIRRASHVELPPRSQHQPAYNTRRPPEQRKRGGRVRRYASLPIARLRAFATDAARELDVLGHDGDALGVDGAEVGVLEEADQVGLRRLLESTDGCALEAQIRLRKRTGIGSMKARRE